MSSTKCHACGLVNFADRATCRRCDTELRPQGIEIPVAMRVEEGRGFWRWALWVFCVTATILISCYVSLIVRHQR
jgi:hypothetical protein